MSIDAITIAPRFRGPARSGNGGYTAGRVAEQVPGGSVLGRTIEVTLRLPPPLAIAMSVRTDGSTTLLESAGEVIAQARAVESALTPVAAVPPEDAEAAMSAFPGLHDHPFPTCFVCGTDRAEGDGLRIFPGPVGDGTVASLWAPDAALADGDDAALGSAFVWAALDCIGGWAGDMEGRRMVLGRMTARVDRLPTAGRPHVVVGGARGQEGRKTFTASTLYDEEGQIVGSAEHTWIAVDPALFN